MNLKNKSKSHKMNKKKLTLNNLKNKLNRSKKRIYNSYDLMNSIDYALLMNE